MQKLREKGVYLFSVSFRKKKAFWDISNDISQFVRVIPLF